MKTSGRRLLAALVTAPMLSLACTGYAHSTTVADPAARNHPGLLVINGAGDGHGVGMSQEGALGLARHGYSYRAILAHYYTGTAIGRAPRQTIVRVLVGEKVVRIPLERYVRGVVSAEMPSTWPAAALQAQAIASRTYALTSDAGGARFQVYADARSQVYRGRAAETPQTNAAVAATAGQIVTYAGHAAITYFFASSGGMTEDVQNGFPGSEPKPWLRGVQDPYDQGPLHSWRVSMTFASAASRLRGLVRGSLRGIAVLERGYSPRIVRARVLGSQGATELGGAELAARLGLDGTWAYFSIKGPRGLRAEPDLSHYAPPTSGPPTSNEGGAEAASPPQSSEGGGEPAAGSGPASSGASVAASEARSGGTATG